MTRIVSFLAAALLIVEAPGFAQGPGPSLRGAWRVVETMSVQGERNRAPQPGLYIFTDRYYSIQWITAERPFFRDNPTEQQRLAAWGAFIAHSGTYAVKGNLLAMRPLVAKNPAVMRADDGTAELQFEGATELRFEGADTAYLTATNPRGATIKLQRVE